MTETIRIAAFSDSHFDEDSRWNECTRIHNWIADDMDQRNIDLAIHVGDWFERTSRIAERNGVAGFLKRVTKKRPLAGVRGNHDTLGDLEIFNDISPNIHIEESARVIQMAGVAVALVAWPQKAKLLSMLDREVSREESEAVARQQLKNIMLGLRDELAKYDCPRILAMHAQVSGSRTSVGQPLVGCDLEVSLEELALTEADLILLGHIHKPQEWTSANGIPIMYCGSPYATTYGETEAKSYITAELSTDRTRPIVQKIERVVTPRQSMILIESTYSPTDKTFNHAIPIPDEADFAGADVRFRYKVDPEYADEAATAAQFYEQSIKNNHDVSIVKIEGVRNSTTRARAPEVVQATTIGDKLKVLWTAKDTMPAPERAASLIAKAEALEQEYRSNVAD